MIRHARRLLLIGCVAMASAACGVADHESAVASQPDPALVFTGELAYRERIALHPRAEAMLELRDTIDDALVASQRTALEGRQVPVGFEFRVAADELDHTREHVLRGGLMLDGRPTWVGADIPVSAEPGEYALGTLWLEQVPGDIGAFSTTMICGDQPIEISLVDELMVVMLGDESFVMQQVPSASGARYASEDAQTSFWSRGERGVLEVRGQAYPECEQAVSNPTAEFTEPVRAVGNEPGWLLEIAAGELRLVLDYGATRITAPAPAPHRADALTRYVLELDEFSIELTLRAGPCADTMTGMPHPWHALLKVNERELQGCAGDPASLLLGRRWAVEQIDGRAVLEAGRPTVNFDREGRVGGRGPCNSWGGAWTLSGESLGINDIVSTMMACAPELMEQERAFFDILAAVNRFEVAADRSLILYAADQRTIRARR